MSPTWPQGVGGKFTPTPANNPPEDFGKPAERKRNINKNYLLGELIGRRHPDGKRKESEHDL